jgi:hypothetical protein
MNAMQLNVDRRAALVVHTRLQLGAHDLLLLRLQAGDRLRSERGTAWITIDGDLQDIVLEPGQVHTVEATRAVNLSAFGAACVDVRGREPLRWSRIAPGQPGPGQRAWQRVVGAAVQALGFYNRPPAHAAGR